MPTRRPRLVILTGLPGCGKTTLARWLNCNLGLTVVSRDDIRRAMFPACQFTQQEKSDAFVAMKAAITTSLSLSIDVCTDGICFSRLGDLESVILIGKAAGAIITVVRCECPVQVAKERVENDRASGVPGNPADRDAKLVERVSAEFELFRGPQVIVDMTLPVDEIGLSASQQILGQAVP